MEGTRIPDWSANVSEEHKKILQQLSVENHTLLSTVEMLHPTNLASSESIVRLKQKKFVCTTYNGMMLVERFHAHACIRKESRTHPHTGERLYRCIVCNQTGKTLWRIPYLSDPDDWGTYNGPERASDTITAIWYELRPETPLLTGT